jgi:aminoglycoside phosphotransferase (APT) family kinase protein
VTNVAHPWTAETELSDGDARSLIESRFAQLAPAQVELFGKGWDNTAFLVNGRYVFRFPRRDFTAPLLVNESRVLGLISPLVPAPVPVPRFVAPPREGQTFPWLFAGYEHLPGRTVCAAAPDDAQRAAMAPQLARFLRALHQIDVTEALQRGAVFDSIDRLYSQARVERVRTCLVELCAQGLIDDTAPFLDVIDACPADYVPRADTLVHGDLYAANVLVDARFNLAGVIDWGDLHVGDPATDLSVAYTMLPPSARDAFFAEYGGADGGVDGGVDDRSRRVARFRAMRHATSLLKYATEIGDAGLLREVRLTLHWMKVQG